MELMLEKELKKIKNDHSEQSIRLYDLEEKLMKFFVYKRMSDKNEVENLGRWLKTERNKTYILILQLENIEQIYLKSGCKDDCLKIKKALNKTIIFLDDNYNYFIDNYNLKELFENTEKNSDKANITTEKLDNIMKELDELRVEVKTLKHLNRGVV